MIKVKLKTGTELIILDGTITGESPIVESLNEMYKLTFKHSGADPWPDYSLAKEVADNLSGEIIEAVDKPKFDPKGIY